VEKISFYAFPHRFFKKMLKRYPYKPIFFKNNPHFLWKTSFKHVENGFSTDFVENFLILLFFMA
jgi:hypothetical protein